MGWWRALKFKLGIGMGPKELSRRLDLPFKELENSHVRYSEVRIPKRSGGMRDLSIPSDHTKHMQRRILKRLLDRLPAHTFATGFEKGRSIVSNAKPHAHRRVVIKMDVIDFFGSTGEDRIMAYFRALGWSRKTSKVLTRLVTWGGSLPQGAPTSPRLSNLVNVPLDRRMAGVCAMFGARYTRYADDITMSFPDNAPRIAEGPRVRRLMKVTEQILSEYGYRAHESKKRTVLYNHRRQMVTGLVVNEGVRLPRTTRRWLRAVRHRKATTGSCSLTDEQLAGWTAFETMINRQ